MTQTILVTPQELEEMMRKVVREELAKARDPESEVLTTRQAGDLLKLHHRTVLARAKAGEIPVHWSGRDPRFFRSELLEWLRAHEQKKAG